MASIIATDINFKLFENRKPTSIYSLISVLIFAICFYILGPVVLFFIVASIVFHEMGHYILFKYYNIEVDKILFTVFNDSYVQPSRFADISSKEWIIISIMGPIAGMLPLLFIATLMYTGYTSSELILSIQMVLLINLLNLIPLKGSDGEKIMKESVALVKKV